MNSIELHLPTMDAARAKIALAPRLPTLSGKTIALLDNGFISLDIIHGVIMPLLLQKMEVGQLLVRTKIVSAALPRAVRDEVVAKADGAITGLGG